MPPCTPSIQSGSSPAPSSVETAPASAASTIPASSPKPDPSGAPVESDSGVEATPSPCPTSTSTSTLTPPELPPRPVNLALPSAVSRSGMGSTSLTAAASPSPCIGSSYSSRMDNAQQASRSQSHRSDSNSQLGTCIKNLLRKYVLLCWLSGILTLLLAASYLAIYFVLNRNTSSMHFFQSVPIYVPSIPLFITSVLVIAFAYKRNRNSHLIKLCGILCLTSAILCVVLTITTTVIHMNRLQSLRECVYQRSTKTCTCFAGLIDPFSSEEGASFAFGNTPSCDVIHGVLYTCLRALFGVSVIGILICIFSSMLVYQLLGHEKKKKYWAQLESRCRHLHRRGPNASRPLNHHHSLPISAISDNFTLSTQCDCCTPNDPSVLDDLYGRSGNVYSPNPMHLLNSEPESSTSQGWQRSATLNSFRNWLRHSLSSTTNGGLNGERQMQIAEDQTNQQQQPWRPPHANHNNNGSESNYGFHPSRVYPNSCHFLSSLEHASNVTPLTHPFVWDPPPPYTQMQGSCNTTTTVSSAAPPMQSQAIQTVSSRENLSTVNSSTPRTSKSGLLPSSSSSSDLLQLDASSTANLLESSKKGGKNYCYSLPSRKMRRKKRSLAKSVANLPQAIASEEQMLIQEVRQKLNALLLYRYQHSKATRELAEVRAALARLQASSHPSPGLAELSQQAADEVDFYEQLKRSEIELPPRVTNKHLSGIARNRNSTSSGTSSIENKYETIEKSLSPYKIDPSSKNTSKGGSRSSSPGKRVQVSIRKQLLQLHEQEANSSRLQRVHEQLQQYSNESSSSSSNSNSRSNNGGGEASSSFHPYLPSLSRDWPARGKMTSISPTLSTSSSSHYAQISPLKGAGRPQETPTYFQEICGQPLRGQEARLVHSSSQLSNILLSPPSGDLLQRQNHRISRSDPKLTQEPVVGFRQPPPRSTPASPGHKQIFPVYLRPEQNIPDIFATTTFQPISTHSSADPNHVARFGQDKDSSHKISRDDIVVTVRSAQV